MITCCPTCVVDTQPVPHTETVWHCPSCRHLWLADGERLRKPTLAEARDLYENPAVRHALGFDTAAAQRRANLVAKTKIADMIGLKQAIRDAQDREAEARP